MVAVNEQFMIAGAQGLSILFASGDQGVWGRSGVGKVLIYFHFFFLFLTLYDRLIILISLPLLPMLLLLGVLILPLNLLLVPKLPGPVVEVDSLILLLNHLGNLTSYKSTWLPLLLKVFYLMLLFLILLVVLILIFLLWVVKSIHTALLIKEVLLVVFLELLPLAQLLLVFSHN